MKKPRRVKSTRKAVELRSSKFIRHAAVLQILAQEVTDAQVTDSEQEFLLNQLDSAERLLAQAVRFYMHTSRAKLAQVLERSTREI